jgi:ADP-heptose:LPS heptosyltransferase
LRQRKCDAVSSPDDRMREALRDISVIQQMSLLRENEYLARLLAGRENIPTDLSDALFSRPDSKQIPPGLLRGLARRIRGSIFGRPPKNDIPLPLKFSHLLNCIREHAWVDRADNRRSERELLALYAKSLNVWKRILTRYDEPYLKQLTPHGGKPGRLRVFAFIGGGGLGDAILFAPVLAALKARLGDCEITLACPPIGKEFYSRSTIVDCVVADPWHEMVEATEAAVHSDIFDLVLFSRCFVPLLFLCRDARIKAPDLVQWVRAHQEAVRPFEHFGTNFGISLLDRVLNVHYLDFFSMLTGLPISANSPIEFIPDPNAERSCSKFKLSDFYVTVRDGANRGDLEQVRAQGLSRTNKQISAEKWQAILSWVSSQGLKIVQVGDSQDAPLPHVERDLRGRTTLSELCFVMKKAVTHIDTEGGLAHFARAIEQPSVIFFPTTSAFFFGYPQNLNIASQVCARCWYSNETWLMHCPRGTTGPECVTTMDIEPMKAFVLDRLALRKTRITRSDREAVDR